MRTKKTVNQATDVGRVKQGGGGGGGVCVWGVDVHHVRPKQGGSLQVLDKNREVEEGCDRQHSTTLREEGVGERVSND